MALYIYGDESGLVGGRFFLIGLLFVDKSLNKQYEKEISDLKVGHRFLHRELHYKRLDDSKIEFAKALVDWYFGAQEAVFKCTVVERESFDRERYQMNLQFISADEMSYNVVYKSALLWHTAPEEKTAPKIIIVDKKDKARPDEFERVIRRDIPNTVDFQEDLSENHNLIQVVDLLVGCVNGDLNGVQKNAKRSVINHIKARLNVQSFRERTAYTNAKFRVAFWKPGRGSEKGPTSA